MSNHEELIHEFILDTAAEYGITEYAVEVMNNMEKLDVPFYSMVDYFRKLFMLSWEEIIHCDIEASKRLYKKYPYFKLESDWDFAKDLRFPYSLNNYTQAIFGDLNKIIPAELFDQELTKIIRPRCDEKIRRINSLFPNTYPENLDDAQFFMETDYFASYDDIIKMIRAFEEIKDRYSELFFKALRMDLNEIEIGEFELLSRHFDVVDRVVPSRFVDYEYVINNRYLFIEEGFDHIDDYVVFNRKIEPWIARQFYDDPSFVQAYIANNPWDKRAIRIFLLHVSSYCCTYTFDNPPNMPHCNNDAIDSLKEIDDFVDDFFGDCSEYEEDYEYFEDISIEKSEKDLSESDRKIISRILPLVIASPETPSNYRAILTNIERAKARIERGWSHE